MTTTTPPSLTQAERELFETWATEHSTLHLYRIKMLDKYAYSSTQDAWAAWQARAAQPAPQMQDVPIPSNSTELTDEEISKIWWANQTGFHEFARAVEAAVKPSVKLSDTFDRYFYAGFMASGEGYNGEYPFGDHDKDPRKDAGYQEALAAAKGTHDAAI